MRSLPTTLLKFDISPTGSIGAPTKTCSLFFIFPSFSYLRCTVYHPVYVAYIYAFYMLLGTVYNTTETTRRQAFFFFVDEYSAPYASCWSFIDLIIARATRCRCIIYTTGGWHVPVQLAANVSISQLSKSKRMLSCCRSRRMKVRYRDGGEEADAIRPLAATLRVVCISSTAEQIRN